MRYISASVISLILLSSINSVGGLSMNAAFAQERENQIVIFSGDIPQCQDGTGPLIGPALSCPTQPGEHKLWAVELDATKYLPNTTFRLEFAAVIPVDSTTCVTLFDHTDLNPISGSEICASNPSASEPLVARVRSTPFTLPAGAHEYSAQFVTVGSGGSPQVGGARIIVELRGTKGK